MPGNRWPATSTAPLGPADRQHLLALARAAVERAVRGDSLPDWSPEADALRAPGAAFVTLRARHDLRGCIGCVEPRRWSLAETVVRMAVAASRDDPRFAPVSAQELGDLTIEVSVLGPLTAVDRFDDIVIGRDGLVVEDGGQRGLLLPQVATEWGWDVETFLGHACRKAGLAPDAWRAGARVYRFEAQVFGEPPGGNR
jgi:hypothetical protein